MKDCEMLPKKVSKKYDYFLLLIQALIIVSFQPLEKKGEHDHD